MICQYAQLNRDALLHISGPDTLKFLQGQTTCDTRAVDATHALPGVFCTPGGRVICDFLLCELAPEHFALRLRRDIRSGASAAFGKYIIFSKAELDASRDDWQLLAVWGGQASTALESIFGELPGARFAATSGDDFVLIQVDEAGEQFECYVAATASNKYLTQMEQNMEVALESEWEALQIQSGIARIESPTVEKFVPQTLNYDLTGHINFKKGCYTGQEVVARLHYRGKPKQRCYVAEVGLNHALAVDTELFDDDSTRSVGSVVNCSPLADKTVLLVAATEAGIANGLRVGAVDGPLLKPGILPYPVNDQK